MLGTRYLMPLVLSLFPFNTLRADYLAGEKSSSEVVVVEKIKPNGLKGEHSVQEEKDSFLQEKIVLSKLPPLEREDKEFAGELRVHENPLFLNSNAQPESFSQKCDFDIRQIKEADNWPKRRVSKAIEGLLDEWNPKNYFSTQVYNLLGMAIELNELEVSFRIGEALRDYFGRGHKDRSRYAGNRPKSNNGKFFELCIDADRLDLTLFEKIYPLGKLEVSVFVDTDFILGRND